MHGGGHVWQGSMYGRGVCVTGMCMERVCMVGPCVVEWVSVVGHAWWGSYVAGGVHGRGACLAGGVHGGGMCGRGHAWRGLCMGACLVVGVHGGGGGGMHAGKTAIEVGSTHPTEMHYILNLFAKYFFQ